MSDPISSLPTELIHKYFDVKIADTQELQRLTYNLRYHVFCEEFQFESAENFPDKQEKDHFDKQAIHCVILHRETQMAVGCVRLLLPTDDDFYGRIKNTKDCLPFERFTDSQFLPQHESPIPSFGELSRLTVHPNFRRRQLDGHNPLGANLELLIKNGYIPQRNMPVVALCMILGGIAMARSVRLDYIYAMMEPKLCFILRHYGIKFTQVGELTNYHGERAPFRIETHKIWNTVNPELKDLLDDLYTKFNRSLGNDLAMAV